MNTQPWNFSYAKTIRNQYHCSKSRQLIENESTKNIIIRYFQQTSLKATDDNRKKKAEKNRKKNKSTTEQ